MARIVYMGTPEFAVTPLEYLIKAGYDIPMIVTVPDKHKGRGLKISQSAVKLYAEKNNIKLLQPENLKDELFIDQLRNINPDLFIVVAFRILPRIVYSIPKLGSFNLHASILPKYRGAAPINWAIINGETESGVTTFFLQDKVDTGNIILQRSINFSDDDNAGTLHNKLSVLGAEVVLETVKKILTNDLSLIIQDDSTATKAPKIFNETRLINWDNPSKKIHNLIRGLSPYPAAYTTYLKKIIKIFESKLSDIKSDRIAGTVEIINNNLFVNTEDYKLQINSLQPEGKKRMTSKEFINGFRINNNLFE